MSRRKIVDLVMERWRIYSAIFILILDGGFGVLPPLLVFFSLIYLRVMIRDNAVASSSMAFFGWVFRFWRPAIICPFTKPSSLAGFADELAPSHQGVPAK